MAEQPDDQPKKKKKQKKQKMSKSSSNTVAQVYFNESEPEYPLTLPLEMLVRAKAILDMHNIIMKPWVTLISLGKHAIEAWTIGGDPIDKKYWWMDQYIESVCNMIWCDINSKYYKEWCDTGILLDVPSLNKRSRGSPESVAEHFADVAVKAFIEPYK